MCTPLPLAGRGRGWGWPQAQWLEVTPHPNPPPQGGREQNGACLAIGAEHNASRVHFANSFRPSRMSCAVSAFSPAMREAPAMAAAACGWP